MLFAAKARNGGASTQYGSYIELLLFKMENNQITIVHTHVSLNSSQNDSSSFEVSQTSTPQKKADM